MSKRQSNRGAKAPLAHYANYFEVGHNLYEFFIDFGQFQPEVAEVVVHTRIALAPTHAKLFTEILKGAVQRYEEDNGAIANVGDAEPLRGGLARSEGRGRRAQARTKAKR